MNFRENIMDEKECYNCKHVEFDIGPFISDALKRIFPERHINELRYTFITRAKECGCNPELIMKWVGHTFDKDVITSRVDRGYTDFSDEYNLKEIEKYIIINIFSIHIHINCF